MTLMKAAERWNRRPSVMILGKDSKSPRFTKFDILFARAYERFMEETCQQCGYPKYICHSDDERIQFDLKRDTCAATAKVEREQDAKGDKKEFGVRLYAEPYLVDRAKAEGLEFSDFRMPYLKEQAKKRGLLIEEDEPAVSGN